MAITRQAAGHVYRAAPGADFGDQQAQVYGDYLERTVGLGSRPVAPEEIVDAARPVQSPLHEAFTWDDTEAAERWRVSEARHLVSHIVVEVSAVSDGTPQGTSRAFHNVREKDEQGELQRGYMASTAVWHRHDLSHQVLDRAQRELRSWRDRYAQYVDLQRAVQGVTQIIDELEAEGGEATENEQQ